MSEKRKKIIQAGAILGTIALLLSAYGIVSFIMNDQYEPTWKEVARITPDMLITGEYNPGSGTSGWLATFCLDYAETPGTCLASNATNGAYDGWGNVSGYCDTDDTDTDLKSEDPFYFVVRCRFNDTVKDGSDFIGSRCRCTLNVTGDETIDDVVITGDSSGTTGGGIVSYNDTGAEFIYINFYWDDNSDGYRITDDGSLDWSIVIEAKY